MSDSGQRNPIELLADEFVERFRRGETPSLDEYADRYPELAEEIHELFPLLVEMEVARSADPGSVPANRIPLVTPKIRQLGDYRIIREIGRGGMGIVYEAEQVSLGRHVALKVLPPNILGRPKHRSRFQRESKAAASLHHTNIVPVFGVGEENGMGYYVMQLIDGHGLDDVLRELKQMSLSFTPDAKSPQDNDSSVSSIASKLCGSSAFGSHAQPTSNNRVPSGSLTVSEAERRGASGQRKPLTYWDNVARIGNQVAKALDHAHQQGILHRDVKPANLLLDLSGNVWVTDFGLASLESDRQLTETGDVLGTLRYMAPESLKGATDARSEVFSLGLTLYELLVLAPAYDQQNRNKLVDSVLSVRIEPIGKLRPEVPSDLQTIVHKAIEPAPDHRYQSAQELAEDLTCFLNDEPIKARRVSLPDRFFRWRRQNRGLAALATSLVLIVTLTAVGSTIAAGYLLSLSNRLDTTVVELRTARNTAEDRADENLRLAKEADSARGLSDMTLADMYTQRGLRSGREGDPAAAALWFANAANLTPHDSVRQSANRMRARNWLRHAMTPLGYFELDGAELRTLEYQPGGSLLMIHAAENLRLWDYRSDEVLPWTNELSEVDAACWSPDGRQLAVVVQDSRVQVHDVASAKLRFDFETPGKIACLAWSPDGKTIATANETVQIWDVVDQPKMLNEWMHPEEVYGLTFNQSGDRLATACKDEKARLYEVSSDAKAFVLGPLKHNPRFLLWRAKPVFCDSDQKLVTVDGNRPYWWDIKTGDDVTPELKREPGGYVLGLSSSKDGNWIAAGGYKTVMLWDRSGRSFRLNHGFNVRNVHFDAKSEYLLTTCLDRIGRRWKLNPASTEPPEALKFPQRETYSISTISSDGKLMAEGDNQHVTVWGVPNSKLVIDHINQWDSSHWQPRISSDGHLASPGAAHKYSKLSFRRPRTLSVIRTSDGSQVGPTIDLETGLMDSTVCSDHQHVAAICADRNKGLVATYHVSTGKQIFEPLRLAARPLSIASRPGANQIAVLCGDGSIVIVDAEEGKLTKRISLASWRGDANGYSRVAYSPDGKTLVAITPADTIEVRDSDSGERKYGPIRPIVRDGSCEAFDISADSRWLATAVTGTNVVRVWDLGNGRPVGSDMVHPGDRQGINSVAFSPDGQTLLTGHEDGNARYWDWQTGSLLVPMMPHPRGVIDAKMTDDGRYAVTATRFGTIYFWDLDSGTMISPPANYRTTEDSTQTIAIMGDRLIASVRM